MNTKSVKITFADGLPLGTRGTFRRDGQWWIALPMSKYQRITAVIDRLLGVHAGIASEMLRWINARPQDAELITHVLERTALARSVHRRYALEKTEARVS